MTFLRIYIYILIKLASSAGSSRSCEAMTLPADQYSREKGEKGKINR